MINLEYYQVFGSLVMAFITQTIYVDDCLTSKSISEYSPLLQAMVKILQKIINNYEYHESIITNQLIESKSHFNASEVAIALFPLIIYCYQSPYKLEQELNKLIELQLLTIKEINSIKILSLIVYLILGNNLNLTIISEQISQESELKNGEEIIEIQIIKKLIKQKLPLTQVEEELNCRITPSNLGIYQALYSFLSMPENLEISLSRSSQFSQQSETTTILTGLLLGLKHGYLTIPYQWRKAIVTDKQIKPIETLSKQLVARWQGKLEI